MHRLRLTLLLAFVGSPAWLSAQPVMAQNPDGIVGLWGYELTPTTQVHGVLTVDGRSEPWQASMGGMVVKVDRRAENIKISLPGDQGSFRGNIAKDQKAITGFWIEPAEGDRAAYASPLTLRQVNGAVWSGEPQSLSNRISEYLQIRRAKSGAMTAFLRNPEYNFAREHLLSVQQNGDAVIFSDPTRPKWQLHAKYDADTGHLQVDWQGIGVFDYTRRDRNHAIGFYARTPESSDYVYRQPIKINDGWTTASLEEVQLGESRLTDLVTRLNKTSDAAGPQVQGLLIARHGKLVLEEYFQGFSEDREHDSRSAGKTFTSLMTGIAIMHGAGFTPDSRVFSLLSNGAQGVRSDPRKGEITVGNLLSMNSGLACDDDNDQSPGNEDVMQSQTRQRDWYKYTADLPMVGAPGADHAVYCTGGINLLGSLIGRSTGMWLPSFFDTYIGQPLQMQDYHMPLMPSGDAYLGGGIYLRPRDFLKLGQLYLSGGIWNGKRVIDANWVKSSTARHSQFTPDHEYGYAWHLHKMRFAGRVFDEYAAEGNGGQFVIVVPELDLVVSIAGGNYGDFKTWYPLQNLVSDYVIPAAMKPN